MLGVCVLLSAGTVSSHASVIDPQMGMEAAGDPNPFNGGVTLTPDANGGGAFEYFNNTGATITQLIFTATIAADLGTANNPPVPDFTCNNAQDPTVPNPFFLFCAVNYSPSDGLLEYIFSGTNPGTGGLDEGIPPLAPGCDNDPNAPGPPNCTQGTFAISLNFNYSLVTDAGGWDTGPLSDPTFTAIEVQTDAPSPEPGSALLVMSALIGGITVLRLHRWRQRAGALQQN
jgi:hypothetical protein